MRSRQLGPPTRHGTAQHTARKGKGGVQKATHLFVANGKLARRLLVVLGKGVQPLHRLALLHRHGKLDVGLCVLVARLRQGGGRVPPSAPALAPSRPREALARPRRFPLGRLTYTTVSSGSAPRRLLRASCICAAEPSKNLPQPVPGAVGRQRRRGSSPRSSRLCLGHATSTSARPLANVTYR